MSGRPLVLAHRGGALEARENSFESFERAIRLGYDGVELDVRCSKDGIPMVVHDRQVKTAADAPWRAVDDLLASELTTLALDTVLALPWGSKTLMVEVKHDAGAERRNRDVAARVARAIRKTRLPGAVFASFSADVLAVAHETEPSVPLLPIVDDESFYKEDLRLLDKLPIFGWAADLSWVGVDEGALRRMRERARRLWVWTVRDLGQLEAALALGADGIITDIPGQVLKRLAEARP